MKILFLDIDGVLNSTRSVIVKIGPTVHTSRLVWELAHLDEADQDPTEDLENWLDHGVRYGLKTVDPVCVALVNKLLEEPNIGLVLSSTHRKFLWHSKVPYGSDEHIRRLWMYLSAMGVKVPQFLSVTPVLHKKRGEEIEAWMNTAYENGLIDDGEPWVILDDAADMLPGQPLVRTDASVGISFDNYAEACKYLGLKEPGLVLL